MKNPQKTLFSREEKTKTETPKAKTKAPKIPKAPKAPKAPTKPTPAPAPEFSRHVYSSEPAEIFTVDKEKTGGKECLDFEFDPDSWPGEDWAAMLAGLKEGDKVHVRISIAPVD
jgi:hypothetical protein